METMQFIIVQFKSNQINFISLSLFTWQHEVKYMVHYRMRRECLTVNSTRLVQMGLFFSKGNTSICPHLGGFTRKFDNQ